MDAIDKITRAKIKLQKDNPFFGYLTLHLKPIEDNTKQTIGVDINTNLYYNSEFVNTLNEDELKGVLAHEIMHIITDDFGRMKSREPKTWNIATDIVNNNILVNNKFVIPEIGLKPHNNIINLSGKIIVDLDKKLAEEVYDEIYKEYKGDAGFDVLIMNGKNGDGNNINVDWKQEVSNAYIYSKMRGNTPDGIERLVDSLIYSKRNWKQILRQYIMENIPQDISYSRPSKNSIVSSCYSDGYYLPSVIEDEILNIVVSIDTSGSINDRDLKMFFGELASISRNYNINATIIICDADIQGVYDIKNFNMGKLKNIKLKGGGGTSHIPVYNWIRKNKRNAKLLINFTDGFTEFPDKKDVMINKMNTIWVLTKNHIEEKSIPFGKILEM